MQKNKDAESVSASSKGMPWWVIFLLPVAFVVIGMLLPAVGGPRVTSRSANCQSNLRNVTLAILNYEAVEQHFPKPVFLNHNGTPRSWRVELLPQLEQQVLRDQYDDDQPWDGPSNIEIGKTGMPLFHCPSASKRSDDSGTFKTNYVLITGPRTVFPGGKRTTSNDIRDGMSNTIIMMEINDSDIAWTEPRDLTIDEAVALFNRPSEIRKKNPTNHKGGRHVAFADGHIEFAPEDIPPEILRALFTIDDGIAASLDDVR